MQFSEGPAWASRELCCGGEGAELPEHKALRPTDHPHGPSPSTQESLRDLLEAQMYRSLAKPLP